LLALLIFFLPPLLDAREFVPIDRLKRMVLGRGKLAVSYLADHRVAGQPEKQILGAALHGGELREPGIEIGLVYSLGMQLLIEPRLQAHRADGLEIARTWTEGEAVEGMEDALIAAQLSRPIGLARWRGWRGGADMGGSRLRPRGRGRAQ